MSDNAVAIITIVSLFSMFALLGVGLGMLTGWLSESVDRSPRMNAVVSAIKSVVVDGLCFYVIVDIAVFVVRIVCRTLS